MASKPMFMGLSFYDLVQKVTLIEWWFFIQMSGIFFRDEKKKEILHYLLEFPEASILRLMNRFDISRSSAYRHLKLSSEEKLQIINRLTDNLQKDTSILDGFIIQNCQDGFDSLRKLHLRFKILDVGYGNFGVFEHEFKKALPRIKLNNPKAFKEMQYDHERQTYFCLINSPFNKRTKKTSYHSSRISTKLNLD